MAKHKKFKQNDNNLAIAYYRFELADAKRRIRDAGCRICLVAEPTPDDSPESVLMETMMEGMAEFYSRQLSQNIRRGMAYNAEHALYNGHKVVDEELFERAQRRLAENKRNGSRRRESAQNGGVPRYWLTGRLFCGECGGSMQGVSGTSKTGAKHYYCYCKEQRAKRCSKKPVRKEWVEDEVTDILKGFLDDSENLASIAVDAAKYYEGHYKGTDYLASLEQQRRDVEKGLANFVRAIEAGIFNEATQWRMAEFQERKEALDDAIAAETVRQSLFADEHSIKAYFDRFLHADFDNAEVRDSVLEYFVDRVYLHEDRLVVASWYSEDNREVPMEVLDGRTENPFDKGEALKFDCFPSGSTRKYSRQFVCFFYFPVPI
ncbi:MAG: recombinase family protein [Dialister sp.]|nr:recombinase family protein [Dialister sp.]